MDNDYLDIFSGKLLRFVTNEFERLDKESARPKKSFTFSVKHCIRGTTAVWGRGEKFSVPRQLTTGYTYTLGKLCEGEIGIPGYKFEQITFSRKATYRVSRVPLEAVSGGSGTEA